MDRDQGKVVFGEDRTVKRERPVGPDQMDAHQERQQTADGDGDEREDKVEKSDRAVIRAEDASFALEPMLIHGWAAFCFAASHWANSAVGRTRTLAFMR